MSRIDIRGAVRTLGIEITSEGDDELIGLCPLHDDARPSFAINTKTGAWICYTGCGSGGLLTLAQRLLGCSYQTAQYHLEREAASIELMDSPTLVVGEEKEIIGPPEFHYIQGKTHHYMIERGFTPATLREWKVGWDFARQAVVIPVIWQGDTVGLIYRSIPPIPEGFPKYLYTTHLPKSRILFGWDMVDWASPEPLILVEGPLDCLWAHQCGLRTAVAILGMSLSRAQADIINAQSLETILCFDADAAGADATKRALKLLGGRGRIVRLPHKDPQECTCSELKDAIGDAERLSARQL